MRATGNEKFKPASVLPMSRREMNALGWDSCDIVIVTGDAYVDHPSFGAALIGRVLEAQGFRVGIIAQPNWNSPEDFTVLGRPNLMFGVTSGNMDSMVNRYTSDCRRRSDDAYSPNQQPGKRPDRAVIAYTSHCRQAFPRTPVILGGLEASLRRAAHYDYWSTKVRRSILLDAKADLLLYGNAERSVVEVAHRLAAGESIKDLNNLPGSVYTRKISPTPAGFIRLPSFEEISKDPLAFNRATMIAHQESHPEYARPLVQRHGNRDVVMVTPSTPLTTAELDWIYELPFSRKPHPLYGQARIPAYEMIRFSITILRGCFGGCSFCSVACHEGRVVQSRSEKSILKEIKKIRDTAEGFHGIISDLGGPTANMYHMGCRSSQTRPKCRRLSCLYPDICKHLSTNHAPLIRLYQRARRLPGIKKILIGSGIRIDLAIRSPEYVRELTQHHVGGYLKVAPEHVNQSVLSLMQKPAIAIFERFQKLFNRYSNEAKLEQYLIPYMIAAHPGTTDEDMLELACWLKKSKLRVDQVQTFLPSPMTLATAMYHTGINPLRIQGKSTEKVFVPKNLKTRRLHKAFARYHDPNHWPLLRKALQRMGREDLIGNKPGHLIPGSQCPKTDSRRKKRVKRGKKQRKAACRYK